MTLDLEALARKVEAQACHHGIESGGCAKNCPGCKVYDAALAALRHVAEVAESKMLMVAQGVPHLHAKIAEAIRSRMALELKLAEAQQWEAIYRDALERIADVLSDQRPLLLPDPADLRAMALLALDCEASLDEDLEKP